jgi:two-component system sensor histidine kinase RegB
MSSTPPPTLTSLCLQYLFLLRAVTVGGLTAALIVANVILAIRPPAIAPIATLISVLALFTLFSWRRIKSAQLVSDETMFVQLVIDLLGLTVLLLMTGGPDNPFASLLLLPVIVAASMIRPTYTWLVATLAALCYSALMIIHVHYPLVHIHSPESGHESHGLIPHFWGMWVGFILSVGVVAFFIAKMGRILRMHDRALATAREKALQANQLATLGTLAAGTAHELGTPLGTMAILSKEIEREYRDNPSLIDKVQLLREQINRCKDILANMSGRAGQAQADAGRPVPIDEYLNEVLDEWRELRPEAQAQTNWSGSRPPPRIIADRTLTQALINVLNNAADAAEKNIEIEAKWGDSALHIDITDDGPGLPDSLREHIGKPFITTKPPGQGMGLGLYLARGTLDRFGGRLELGKGRRSGTCVKIELPLSTLLATDYP